MLSSARPGFPASRLAFGCAPMLGRVGRAQSLRALAAAWNHGITLYDVARSYGYGGAEGLLGEFLQGKRDRALISTKFGIPPAAQQGWKQALKPAARTLLRFAPGLRGAVRRGAGASDTASHDYSVAMLHSSLEHSLRALRTDYVDVLFCHAAPASVLAQDDLMDALARLVEQGKARRVGLATDAETVALALARPRAFDTPLNAMQFPVTVFATEILSVTNEAAKGCVLLANHPFGGVTGMEQTRARLRELAQDARLPPMLREKLAGDDPTLLADAVFAVILHGTGIDAVVASMMRVENVAANARAVTESRFDNDEARLLRERLQVPRPTARG